jgi:hypothetical protein
MKTRPKVIRIRFNNKARMQRTPRATPETVCEWFRLRTKERMGCRAISRIKWEGIDGHIHYYAEQTIRNACRRIFQKLLSEHPKSRTKSSTSARKA